MNGLLAIGNRMKESGHMHVHDMAEWVRRPACFMHLSSQGIASAERGGYHIGRSLFPEAEVAYDPPCGGRVRTLFGRMPKGGYIESRPAELEMRAEHNVAAKAANRQFLAAESEVLW